MHIRLIPAAGYISPDNKMAVFYPDIYPSNEAKLLPLPEKDENKYIEILLEKTDKDLFSILNSAAGSNKKIQIFLDDSLKITGCLFPSP
jgi:hypothetical protein